MKADDFCPFEPTEPRCRECRGKPCGDFDKDMDVPGPRLPGPEIIDLADVGDDYYYGLGD